MSPRHHVVITGTGRTETTFLVELFTHLGLETGFSKDNVTNKKDTLLKLHYQKIFLLQVLYYLIKLKV